MRGGGGCEIGGSFKAQLARVRPGITITTPFTPGAFALLPLRDRRLQTGALSL